MTQDTSAHRPRLRLLLGGYFLSASGSGAVFPFLAGYLRQVIGLSAAAVAAALLLLGGCTLAGNLVAGHLVAHLGLRQCGAVGLLAQAAGYAVLGCPAGLPGAYGSVLMFGFGTGLFQSVLVPVINVLCEEHRRRRAFAARYLCNNLGLGLGAVLGSMALDQATPQRFTIFYQIDAGTYLVFLVIFVLVVSGHTTRSGMHEPVAGYRSALRDRLLLRLAVVQILLVAAGYSQIQTVIPLLLQARLDLPVRLIGLAFVVNTFGVVVVQPVVLRLTRKRTDTSLLSLTGVVWGCAFLVGALSSVGGRLCIPAIMAFVVLFTVGECLYGVSLQPLLVTVSPPGLLATYSSIVSSCWGLSAMAGPPVGVLMVTFAPTVVIWIVCAGAVGLAAQLSRRIQHGVPPTRLSSPPWATPYGGSR